MKNLRLPVLYTKPGKTETGCQPERTTAHQKVADLPKEIQKNYFDLKTDSTEALSKMQTKTDRNQKSLDEAVTKLADKQGVLDKCLVNPVGHVET